MKERFGAKRRALDDAALSCADRGLDAHRPAGRQQRGARDAAGAGRGAGRRQSLHTNSRDEALALPTEQSALLALRTQQMIAHESGVADTVDPLGGVLLRRDASRANSKRRRWSIWRKIDELGGAVAAIERGYMQREIQNGRLPLPARDRSQASASSSAQPVYARRAAGRSKSCASILRSSKSSASGWAPACRAQRRGRRRCARIRSRRRRATARNLMPAIIDAVRDWRDARRNLRRDAPGVRRVSAGQRRVAARFAHPRYRGPHLPVRLTSELLGELPAPGKGSSREER